MVDLRQLRSFVIVAETEHVGQAAARLHISQSPLSRQIIQLEAQLGLVLFERVRQRVRLTEEGRILLADARALIAQAERLETNARRLGCGETGTLAIGYVEAAIHCGLLPRALARLRATKPGVHITLHALRSGKQIDALRSRNLDIALLYTPPISTDEELTSVEVANDTLVLASPADHRISGTASLMPGDLDGAPWIAMPRAINPAARDRFLAACQNSGFTPDIRLEAAEPLTILSLVGAGLGAAMVQTSLRTATPAGVIFRDLPWFPLSVKIHVAWRQADPKPLVAAFLEAVNLLAAPTSSSTKMAIGGDGTKH